MEGEQVDARPFDFELETVDLLIQGEDLLGDLRIEARQAIHGLPNRQLGQFRQGAHVLVQLPSALAMQSRCCWPPERLAPLSSRESFTSSHKAACFRLPRTALSSSSRLRTPLRRNPAATLS